MTQINPNQPKMTFKDQFSQAAQDKRITAQEAKDLNAYIDRMELPAEDKEALKQMVSQLEDATNDGFNFFGLKINWASGINAQEKAGLESLAQNNRLAGQLLMFYNEAANQESMLDQGLIKGPQQPAPYNPPSAYTGNAPPSSHAMNPNGVNFSAPRPGAPAPASGPAAASAPAPGPAGVAPTGPAAPVDNTPMGNMEAELYQAIKNYPGNKATDAEAREIARTLNEAAQAMGFSAENTRKMLAVFAHESGGFDPRARSHTGAGGLGQLTGVAIEDMQRLSRAGGPYAQHSDKFVRPGGDRTDIRSNVWTSVAYMHHLMGQIGSQDISNAFVAYNTGVGGYRALMTMGSDADAYLARATGVAGKANEARAYAGHVNAAYNRMFA